MNPIEPMLSIKQLAELLAVSTASIRNLIRAGKLPPPTRVGRQYRWRREAIDRWLSQ